MQLKLLFRLRLGPEPGKRLMFKSVSVLVYLSLFKSSILLYSQKNALAEMVACLAGLKAGPYCACLLFNCSTRVTRA